MMRLLNRYVIRRCTVATCYALAALCALYSFFDIMAEIEDLGKGAYNGARMLQYVLLLVPAHAYELMPLAVLLGALATLSQMAAGSELTVIKTSGISLRSLIAMLLQFGAVFAVATVLLGEWVVPASGQYAERMKLNATQNSVGAGSKSGIWMNQGNDIVNVSEMLPDGLLRGITVYRHNDRLQLTEVVRATEARPETHGGLWHLYHVSTTRLGADSIGVVRQAKLDWPIAVDKQLLNVLLVEPEQMSATALYAYVQHLRENHQITARYELAWWRKIAYPFASMVMALLALAFVPHQTRHNNMGWRLFFGICVGLAFHFSGLAFGFGSQIYGIPAWLSAFLPTLLFLAWALYWIRSREKR